MIKNYLSYAVAAALLAASGTSNLAFAIDEEQPEQLNKPFNKPQGLVIDESRKVEVKGRIGSSEFGAAVADTDFYAFHGKAGNVVRLDIDGGIKAAGTGRSLNSLIAIFRPDGTVLAQKNDVGLFDIDEGSIARFDPWIENITLPVDGIYTVGVTSDAMYADRSLRVFLDQGQTSSFDGTNMLQANGTYTLLIDGVSKTELMQQISIDIKPNAKSITTHANSNGKIPVALITSAEFDALKADRDSIKFGPPNGSGTPGKCNKNGANLLCHFDKGDAGFAEDDTEGMVSGTIGGKPFQGRGWLKVIPVRSKD
jgi:hypothetical protein